MTFGEGMTREKFFEEKAGGETVERAAIIANKSTQISAMVITSLICGVKELKEVGQ